MVLEILGFGASMGIPAAGAVGGEFLFCASGERIYSRSNLERYAKGALSLSVPSGLKGRAEGSLLHSSEFWRAETLFGSTGYRMRGAI